MKHFIIFITALSLCGNSKAQLYINSDITIQNGVTMYADDTIQLALLAAVSSNGILQSTKTINTNGYMINTGTTGYIISPVASGVSKAFDIGTTTNNKIQLQHSSGSTVNFQLAVRDTIYQNPQTRTTPISTRVVGKTWVVQPLSAATSSIVTISWNAGDELTSFTRGNCGMSRWQNGITTSWSFLNGTNAATNTGTSPAYSRTSPAASLGNSIYYFGIGDNGSTLPVTLVSFDAKKIADDDVLVTWTTTTEINNDHFDIERSDDGSRFTVFAQVKGAGNSTTRINYLQRDITPFSRPGRDNVTKLYYRLKQVDVDGNYQNSEIREVDMQKVTINNLRITTYPNPNKELLNIELETTQQKIVTIHLYDANGKNILDEKHIIEAGKQTFQINTSPLAPGVYLLNVTDENNAKIGKQKLIIY